MSYPVSLAGLPDLAKLLPSDFQPSAQPTADFLAILDRAIGDTGSASKAAEDPTPIYDPNGRSPTLNKTNDNQNVNLETTRRDAATAVPQTQPLDPSPKDTESDASKASAKSLETVKTKDSKEPKDISVHNELGSPYLRKHREREDESVRHTVPHLDHKYQNGVESLGQAAVRLVQETNQLKAGENTHARIGKPEPKTRTAPGEAHANQLANLKHKASGTEIAAEAKSAAALTDKNKKQPDWNAFDGNIRGLKDAMSTVQNLAQRLGLNDAAATGLAAPALNARAGEQALRVNLIQNGAKAEKKAGVEGIDAGDLRSKRLEQTRSDRMRGRDLDGTKLEVSDHRGLLGKSSLVLENMLAENNNAKSSILVAAQQGQPQIKGDEAGGKRDQISLVNTAFYTPAGPVVQMPVSFVPSAQGGYQQSIKQWLDRNGNNDIVQQAKIILNGNDSGEIRLILKPENLGEVRINLQLEDGRIGGSIFVENKDVQSAFEGNLDALRQAFEDSGLQTGNLQVNVDAKGSGSGGNFSRNDGADDDRHTRYAAEKIESSVASVGSYEGDFDRVNLMA